ncbi:MAG: hypothetical protein R2733_23495 [Acidimicrobiales bacterium]
MNASTTDHRHFAPAGVVDGAELRRCRNCGELVVLARGTEAGHRAAALSRAS